MRYSVFAYSKKGLLTARRILDAIEGDASLYTVERLAGDGALPIGSPSSALYGECFNDCDALIFVSSVGIAVRCIAPFVKSKTEDPAVIAVDELGGFVIPVLSGHIGGANALAKRIASTVGAEPVITTATDINGRFSVDSWAKRNGFFICDMERAKKVSAAILEGEVPLKSDFPIAGAPESGIALGESGAIGIYLTYTEKEPFETTLRLVPKCLRLGIGCRRGTPKEAIAEAVRRALSENGIDHRAVKCAASIDIKRDEAGLLEFCREAELPIEFYTAAELNAVSGDFSGSEFVKGITGVDNVCERAAMLGADSLIIKKNALCGVTVAAALLKTEVNLG